MLERILHFLNTNLAPLAAVAALVAKIAIAACGVLLLRLRQTRKRTREAEARAAALQQELENTQASHRRFMSLLTHELRTPLGAITGYQELIADGMFGRLDARGDEAISRIRSSGDQMVSLLDGVTELVAPGSSLTIELSEESLGDILHRTIANANALAPSRGVKFNATLPEILPGVETDAPRLSHALDLVLGAAIRASQGRNINFAVRSTDGAIEITLDGTGLDPVRDDPALPLTARDGSAVISTGSGLRLAMAARLLHSLKSELTLHPNGEHTSVVVRLWAGVIDRT